MKMMKKGFAIELSSQMKFNGNMGWDEMACVCVKRLKYSVFRMIYIEIGFDVIIYMVERARR